MDIVIDSVNKLEEILRHSGCEEGPVELHVRPDAVPCQYERGACMEAYFGGRSAEFTTFDPIRAKTRVGFMFGAPLDTPATRGAACAIMNAVAAFLCLIRNPRACPPTSHPACIADLKRRIGAQTVFCLVTMPVLERELGRSVTADPESADIILVNGEGIISPEAGGIIGQFRGKKTILLLGPCTAGISGIEQLERYCPYGT